MERLLGARIQITPRPAQRRDAVLEVAMLGHCPTPDSAEGAVRVTRLCTFNGALDEMRAIGYGQAVDALLAGNMADGSALSEQLAGLFHLPIPFRSSAEFHDIFPTAATANTVYISLLAGKRAWLPQAVDDFFANGGEKLWVVRIPETVASPGAGQQQFLPLANTNLITPESLRGLATVLVIPALAVVAFPDLERLQIPPQLPDVSRVRLENPNPQFLPWGTNTDDDHRERRYSSELPNMPEPPPLEEMLRGILQFTAKYRPDLQCLFSLPLAYSGETDTPAIDRQALQQITAIRNDSSGHLLRQIQFLFPYLRGPGFALRSAVGLIAGKQAAVARAKGPWHSIGGQPLLSAGQPYPRLTSAETLALRTDPGVGVLTIRTGSGERNWLSLDDERLTVPALPPADYAGITNQQKLDGFRAAEIMRFLGFLRRQLQALGEQLVFNVAVDDPRPRILLEQFFRRLYNQGALRGAVAEDAYQIQQSSPQEGAIQFDIQVAPAFPIDRLFLTFINAAGEWRLEMSDAGNR